MAWGTINEISEVQLQCNGTLLVSQLTCRSNIIRPTVKDFCQGKSDHRDLICAMQTEIMR